MEPQAALVRADCAVELYTIADIYLHLSLVVYPRYAEGDDTLRFNKALDQMSFLKLGVLVIDVLD